MNCIFLLLLLGCCGGFGGNGNGGGCGGTSYQNDSCGRGSSFRSGNNIGRNYSDSNDGCGCQEGVAQANDGCGCGQDEALRDSRNISGMNPPHWQDYPEISRRDNNCDCEN